MFLDHTSNCHPADVIPTNTDTTKDELSIAVIFFFLHYPMGEKHHRWLNQNQDHSKFLLLIFTKSVAFGNEDARNI